MSDQAHLTATEASSAKAPPMRRGLPDKPWKYKRSAPPGAKRPKSVAVPEKLK